MKTHRTGLAIATSTVALTLVASACTPPGPTTTRVSLTRTGSEVNGDSIDPAITPDGRFVVYESSANDFGDGSANESDVWLFDRADGSLDRISKGTTADDIGGRSGDPSPTSSANTIAFTSTETRLAGVAGDDRTQDVYVREQGVISLVSVATNGGVGNGTSSSPDMAHAGRYLAFTSHATNLVAGDTNGRQDVFLRDLSLDTTTRISLTADGGQVFADSHDPAVSSSAVRTAFRTTAALSPLDRDFESDVYVWDRVGATLQFASIDGPGADAASAHDISGDGRYVAFVSTSGGGAPQVFVRDLQTSALTLVSHRAGSSSPGNGTSVRVRISSNGDHVAFSSFASDLVAGDTNGAADHFVAGRDGSDLVRVSVRTGGGQSAGSTARPDVADQGLLVTFAADVPDLVGDDTNGVHDVFVHDRRSS
jgi:Tol biopolymer transport system component